MRLAPVLASVALSLSLASAVVAQVPTRPGVTKKAKKDDKPQGPIIQLIGFEAIAGGGSRLYLELSGSPTVTQHDAQGQLVYVLENTQIRTGNTENALELYYHNTPILRAKLSPSKKDAELLLQLKADVRPTQKIVEAGKGVYRVEIDFPAGNFAPGPDAPSTPPPPPAPPRKDDRSKKAPAAPVAPKP